MSFEGHYSRICFKGHDWETNVYDNTSDLCPDCGEPAQWEALVDETNGEPVEAAVLRESSRRVIKYVATVKPDPSDKRWNRVNGDLEL